jgi:integrase
MRSPDAPKIVFEGCIPNTSIPLPAAKPLPTDTLYRALDKAHKAKWAHLRSGPVMLAQGNSAIQTLRGLTATRPLGSPTVDMVKPEDVARAIISWQADKLAPDTIRKRLNVLRAMGVDLGKAEDRPKLSAKRPLKWWLNPTDHARLTAWLRNSMFGAPGMYKGEALMLAAYIDFVAYSGLRVEEALALPPRGISYSFPTAGGNHRERASVTVMGTKTAGSHATLPLMPEAYDALERAWRASTTEGLHQAAARGRLIFNFGHTPEASYIRLAALWEHCREYLGVKDNPTATLKALRRVAARNLHIVKGMPLDMVREYLRHENIKTTQEYLKLTGGYGEKEMRAWLTK